MDILSKIKGVTYLGAENLVASVRFGAQRSFLERRVPRDRFDVPLSPPGRFKRFESDSRGGVFHFPHATLELRFLAGDLLRVTWQPGRLPVPYPLAAREWEPVTVRAEASPECVRLVTSELEVEVDSQGGLRMKSADGRLLREDLPPLAWRKDWVHRARLQPEERCYGLGERNTSFNQRGKRLRMWNTEPRGAYVPDQDPIYICVPGYLGLHAQGSYLVFFENSNDGEIRLEDEARTCFKEGALRYYLIPGPPDRALRRFHDLTGRPPLPPRWALGFHQARWSYMNEGEVRALVDGFLAHDLPLSVVHLDIHYMDAYRVFTVNQERFPDLAGLARDLAGKNVGLVVIIDPGVKIDPNYRVYQEGQEQDLFCKYPDASPVVAPVWPGDCHFPDFTDPRARTWWGDQYRLFTDAGIDGFWHDMNEPAAFTPWGEATLPTSVRHVMEGRGGDHTEAHNVYALLEARAGFEGLKRLRPDRRPWILSRAGCAGLQRYAWSWTGDSESTWDGLKLAVRHTLGLSLSGLPYTGSDVGGFGGRPTPELFVRWFQLASFLPFFRVHSAFFTPPREPWAFGEPVLSILRDYLKLRYRLLPYLYTLAWEASEQGHPLVRPLFWLDETDRALWDVEDAFMVGPALLVAPVVAERSRGRSVRLPAGTWYDYWTGLPMRGGETAFVAAPLERIPLFVRAGTVLPTEEGQTLVLHVYPPAGEDAGARRKDTNGRGRCDETGGGVQCDETGGGVLYSDAGDGYGPHRVERFALNRKEGGFELARFCEGDFPCIYEGIELFVHGPHGAQARVDGVARSFDGDRVRVGEFSKVEVTR